MTSKSPRDSKAHSNDNLARIRIRVFLIWFFTLTVVVVTFAEKISGIRHIPPQFPSFLQSLQMMLGLVLPQIGMMTAFYFNLDRQRERIESLSDAQVLILTLFSVVYHTVFIGSLIFGITFHKLVQGGTAGEMLERNTAAVVAIMGLFSLFLTPIAFLFSRPIPSHNSLSEADPAKNDN